MNLRESWDNKEVYGTIRTDMGEGHGAVRTGRGEGQHGHLRGNGGWSDVEGVATARRDPGFVLDHQRLQTTEEIVLVKGLVT